MVQCNNMAVLMLQAVPRGHSVPSVPNAGHRPTLLQGPHHQTTEDPLRTPGHGAGGGQLHAEGHTRLLPELAWQDI